MSEQFNISSSPHIRSKVTTSNIMMLVTIALLPTTIFGVYNFGLSALGVVLITTGTAVLTEYLYQKLMHKKVTIQDFSAVVTGLLLDVRTRKRVCYFSCKATVWRIGTEFYEPGAWREMLPADFVYRKNDNICI